MCFLLTSLGFPDPITLSLILRTHGPTINPYFLCLRYFRPTMTHSHFSTSYTAHEFAILLFPDFFKLDYFFKAHLSILWTCDPLFLPLGLNIFLFFYQFFSTCVVGLLLSIWLPKIIVNNVQSKPTLDRPKKKKKLSLHTQA